MLSQIPCYKALKIKAGTMELGKRIKALRKKEGMTQVEFAEKLGKKQPHIVSWERGEKIPSLPFLKKIAQIFNISLDLLVMDEGDFKELKKHNQSLAQRLRAIENMSETDKEAIIKMIDALSSKNDK